MARLSREESQARTRNLLIEAARDEIVKKGFAQASVRDIADAAGFSLGAFYSNFPEKEAILLERVLSLLKVPGEGPLVLRIGGDSADHSFWYPTNPGAGRAPHWVYELNSRWLRRAVALVRDLGARVILDLNLITDTPADAAGWARAALARFPRHSVIGFEIGNEPDLYARRYWMAAFEHRWLDSPAVPAAVTDAGYGQSFESYADVLAQVAPRIVLLTNLFRDQLDRYAELQLIAGRWRLFDITTKSLGVPGQFLDFPTMGFDPNNVIITGNIYNASTGAFVHSDVYIISRARLGTAGGSASEAGQGFCADRRLVRAAHQMGGAGSAQHAEHPVRSGALDSGADRG